MQCPINGQDSAIEKHPFDSGVVMEILDWTEEWDGRAGGDVKRWGAVR